MMPMPKLGKLITIVREQDLLAKMAKMTILQANVGITPYVFTTQDLAMLTAIRKHHA